MNKEELVSVAIPTIGRVELLNSVLLGIFNNRKYVDEVVILDESDVPIMESYQVNQAIDLLSLDNIEVKILRNRNRKGIGAARYKLAKECKCDKILMIDDDVVIGVELIKYLIKNIGTRPWAVPYCLLVPKLNLDGYITEKVNRYNPEIIKWVGKYPWFLPYFNYDMDLLEELDVAGTQAILLDRKQFLDKCIKINKWGNIPREDTYMTRMMGTGVFVSTATCYHFEHNSQQERIWDKSMFYKIHEAIIQSPKLWEGLMDSLN